MAVYLGRDEPTRLEMVLMRTTRHRRDPVLITDAPQSLDEELRERKKVYAILMVVHLIGFTLAGVLALLSIWWWSLGLMIATGGLPWIAVVLANDRRVDRTQHRAESPDSWRLNRSLHGTDRGSLS